MNKKLLLAGALLVVLSIPFATRAQDVQLTAGATINVSLTSPAVTYTLTSTTGINTFSVSDDTLTLTLDGGDNVTVTQASGFVISNNLGAETTCSGTTASITFTSTVTITSSSVQQCSTGGGGGQQPTGVSISINAGASQTTSRDVTLTLTSDNASEMIVSNLVDFSGASWESFAASKSWTLTEGLGEKRVYVNFKSILGDQSTPISDTIQLVAAPATPSTPPSTPPGGGGGGSGFPSVPPQAQAPSVTLPTPGPQNGGAVVYFDPSDKQSVLTGLGETEDIDLESQYGTLVSADAKSFGVTLSADKLAEAKVFVSYGLTGATVALGAGERRALLRDYFQTTQFGNIHWDDVARLAVGQKILNRNLKNEQAQVSVALRIFKAIYKHNPNFQNTAEDLAWNTLMYRIRFVRDLASERAGIALFVPLFGHSPKTPLDWSTVRVLGYIH